ncbi:MAG: DUF1848 domain-containing protein [Dehalococcoidia bacterium]|nr:DUF1848 domain-containing protein [Dehalococcoidia bacterium]
MKVISASRRTDIPAFYSKWLLGRLRAGFCHWRNPFGGQVYRVSLLPEDCLAIVFWTRNPAPLLPALESLRQEGYRFYFHFTINGYPRALESHSPPVDDAIRIFRQLAETMTPELVLWRYDPIVLGDLTPESHHLDRFDYISRQLEGYTRRCYFSFVDFYGKTERNLKRLEHEHGPFRRPSSEERRRLVDQLRDIARSRDIALYSCSDKALAADGIEKAHCIDGDIIARLRPELELRLKNVPTRRDCGCVQATDIGAYDTCAFGCAYCYATNSHAAALDRLHAHDHNGTILWSPPSRQGMEPARIER